MINLGEWKMIMRGPRGEEYEIAKGQLPATLLPHHNDDGAQVLTIELAHFVRSLGDQIEQLCIEGEAEATYTVTDEHEPTPPTTPLQ